MCDAQNEFQHFLLTRFNILLWRNDKEGCAVRTKEWLEHRFMLFEQYCLPSIGDQTCQTFEWIVLFDANTPELYKLKIKEYQNTYPQFVPVYVAPEKGRLFAEIFRREIVKRLNAKRVISTYLDNDDALSKEFVGDLQSRTKFVDDGTFIYYDDGYQYYTEDNYLMKIRYNRNHFVSVVESGNSNTIKSIFGYGGHYYIDKLKSANIVHVNHMRMWCEVVHEKNMINDANFLLGTRLERDVNKLRNEFAIEKTPRNGIGVYFFIFLPRYLKTFAKRAKNKLFGREW